MLPGGRSRINLDHLQVARVSKVGSTATQILSPEYHEGRLGATAVRRWSHTCPASETFPVSHRASDIEPRELVHAWAV